MFLLECNCNDVRMSVHCFDCLESTSSISGNRKWSCDDQCGFCTKLGDMSEALFLCSSANIQCSAVCCWQYLTISAFDGCHVEIHLYSLCSLGAAASDRAGSRITAWRVSSYCSWLLITTAALLTFHVLLNYASVRMRRRHAVVGLCVCVSVCL